MEVISSFFSFGLTTIYCLHAVRLRSLAEEEIGVDERKKDRWRERESEGERNSSIRRY